MADHRNVLALMLDTGGRGGAATVNHWYLRWMDANGPQERVDVYLSAGNGAFDYVRRAPRWRLGEARIPLLLPRLQVPQYAAGRRLLRREKDKIGEVHTIGAHVVHGSLVDWPVPSLVWISTTIKDERERVLSHQPLRRRIAYGSSLPWLHKIEMGVLLRARRVLVQSPYTAGVLTDHGISSDRIELVPVPVDTDLFTPSSTERAGVLFVGRARDPRKNFGAIERLIASSPTVAAAGVDVVSDEDPRPSMDPATARSVRWWDYSDDVTELATRYQSARLLVLSSIQEGLGLVVFEALACGTPAVALRCGGPDAFLQQSGGGFVAGDEDELRMRVEQILAAPGLGEELGGKGRAWVEHNMSASSFLADNSIFKL